jgi:hypothetical protein
MFVRLLLCAVLCMPLPIAFAGAIDPSGPVSTVLDFPDGDVNDLHELADAVAIDPCSEFGDCTTALPAPAPVPEPGSLLLMVGGLLALGAGRYAAPRPLAFS